MSYTTDQRIERLREQLMNPGLSARDIELIEKKIAVLKSADE